jgi:ferredoxin
MIIDRSKQQKNLLEMLQEKNEYISAPCNGNGICGKCIVRYKRGATEPTRRDREVFSEKQLEDGYRLACQSHPVGAYEVELPESEETIEVLSEWGKQQKTDTEELTEAYTQTPAEAKTSGGIQDKETAEGTAEKTENAIYDLKNIFGEDNVKIK